MIQTDIFLTEVYDFLKSATIKNTYLADVKRTQLEEVSGVELDDETENPYYLNLIGEYSDLDQMMYVTSIDDGTTIEFTKSNLAIHHKTYTTYKIPNEQFQDLIDTYPTQADLIKSILYPVSNINEAIAAPNFSLLTYDSELLEDQEVSSILDSLTTFLTMYRERWNIPEFYYEAYYPMTEWWMLWTLLPLVIFRQRISNIGTSRAHTTQIWEYLTSNGLGDYRSVLNFTEQMFLYKNLRYLIQNRGKDGTLSILSENLLYPRNTALRAKSAMLYTEDSEETVRPSAEFISKDIRDLRTPTEALINGIETHQDIFEREVENGLEPKLDEKYIAEQKLTLDHSKLGWLPTKLVEIQKLNIYDEFHELYVNIMVETILYRISRDELDYNLEIKISDSQTIPLTVKEAVALLFYTMGREYETSVTLSSTNIDTVVGKEITLNDGSIIAVTEGNKNDYVGMTVDVRNPFMIPTTAHIVHAFKDEFPTIEQEFQFNDSIWRINRLIDYDDIFDRIETNVGVITTPERLLELIDGHFFAIVTDIRAKHGVSNTAYQFAYDLLYKQLLATETITLDFGIPHTTYNEWFSDNQFLQDAITSLDNNVKVKETYHNVSNAILEAIIPITESTQTTFDQFTAEEFRLIKQLFVQLCSYNIAFLDTELSPNTYIRFAQTTYNDKWVLDYFGEMEFDASLFDSNVEDTIEHTTEITMEITKEHNVINHNRVNNFNGLFPRGSVVPGGFWTIADLDVSTKFWLDAPDTSSLDLDGILINEWLDKGSLQADMTHKQDSYRPSYGVRSQNGLPMVYFDGTNSLYHTTNKSAQLLDKNSDIYIFTINAIDQLNSYAGVVMSFKNEDADYQHNRFRGIGFNTATVLEFSHVYYDDGGTPIFISTMQDGRPIQGDYSSAFSSPIINYGDVNLSVTRYNRTEDLIQQTFAGINGEDLVPGNVSICDDFDATAFFIGSHGSETTALPIWFQGAIGEAVIAVNPSLIDVKKIEGYLAHKWGINTYLPLDHPYIAEAPLREPRTNGVTNSIINRINRFDLIQSSEYRTTE